MSSRAHRKGHAPRMCARSRTDKQAALLAYKRAAPIAIQETHAEANARADRIEAAVITAVHDWIWAQRPWCQLCAGSRRDECAGFPDEMHEDPPRSKTRGLPPEQRFNLIICGRLCKACHRDVTEHRLRVVFDNPAHGFMGRVTATATKEE